MGKHSRQINRGTKQRSKTMVDLSLTNHVPYFALQPGHGLRQGSIDLSGNHQQRVAGAIVDPVVRGGRHCQMTARHIGI
jgi:hypothetical protein